MRQALRAAAFAALLIFPGFAQQPARPAPAATAIRGWTILSDSEPDARAVIAAAADYRINHLQLSHEIVHDLRDLVEPKRQGLVRRLIDAAHGAGILEVVLWDHALYDLAYYPAQFRTGPGGTLDLDNPAFWQWLKDDYRKLLDLAPGANGIVLTFNREFHHWKDVIDHLAPAWAKTPKGAPQLAEVPWVVERGWLREGDRLSEVYVNHVQAEKAFGVRLAEESLRAIESARPVLRDEAYRDLRHYFARTLLTAKIHRAVAAAYFGFRVYARGEKYRTPSLMKTVREALVEIPELARASREYPVKPATGGQWNWVEDADAAMRYYDQIAVKGWPKETHGIANPYAGLTFPLGAP